MTTIVDMTKSRVVGTGTPRRRRRSQRDINKYWNSRYAYFIKVGYTEQEASWAANKGCSPRDARIKKLVDRRKAKIEYYMKYKHLDRDQAIRACDKDRREHMKTDAEEDNIFVDSP
jgi:hypothetical protein